MSAADWKAGVRLAGLTRPLFPNGNMSGTGSLRVSLPTAVVQGHANIVISFDDSRRAPVEIVGNARKPFAT